jgi:hypothetical protein
MSESGSAASLIIGFILYGVSEQLRTAASLVSRKELGTYWT